MTLSGLRQAQARRCLCALGFGLGCAFVLGAAPQALAATQCPSGQMYRVTKKVCAPVSENLQFLQRSAKRSSAAKTARLSAGDRTSAKFTNSADPQPQPRPLALSPFGTLPALKCSEGPAAQCTPAKLFNVQ